jgi:chromosome segregation ATPase
MTDSTSHTLELLRRIREESAQGFQQVNQRFDAVDRKIGAMAETINSMRVELQTQSKEIHALRTDMQTMAVAVDEHTARLTEVEQRLPPRV